MNFNANRLTPQTSFNTNPNVTTTANTLTGHIGQFTATVIPISPLSSVPIPQIDLLPTTTSNNNNSNNNNNNNNIRGSISKSNSNSTDNGHTTETTVHTDKLTDSHPRSSITSLSLSQSPYWLPSQLHRRLSLGIVPRLHGAEAGTSSSAIFIEKLLDDTYTVLTDENDKNISLGFDGFLDSVINDIL